jgi:hypothetical protein
LESALDHTDDSLDRREGSGLEKSKSGGPDDGFTTNESADRFDNSERGLGSGYHHTPKSADEFEWRLEVAVVVGGKVTASGITGHAVDVAGLRLGSVDEEDEFVTLTEQNEN